MLERLLENVEILLSRYVVHGDLSAYNVLYQHGELRAMMTQVRKRTQAAAGGQGVVVTSTDEPEIKRHSRRLMFCRCRIRRTQAAGS